MVNLITSTKELDFMRFMVYNIFMFLVFIIILSYNPTTLVYPPFGHTMGYHSATSLEARLLFGNKLSFNSPYGISAVKLKSDDKPGGEDDDELTVYCCNMGAHQIVYNKSLMDVKTYGKFGRGLGEFWSPTGIAASPDGWIWVADAGNHRIVKLFNTGDTLLWVQTIGSFGCAELEFDGPYDVACDFKNNIYVTDEGNGRIQVIDSLGNLVRIIDGLYRPKGIAVVARNDRWNYQRNDFIVVLCEDDIKKFSMSGKLLAKRKGEDFGLTKYNFAFCMIDYYGHIWVTDRENGCIHKFDRDLKYITSFGRKGSGDKEFIDPRGITIWRRFGQVFVVDATVIDYYWIGVDGYIKGCFPPVFTGDRPGTDIVFFITEPAIMDSKIYDSKGNVVREFVNNYEETPFEHYLIWDGRDNYGEIVPSGEYRIELVLTPTYSSRKKFEKILDTQVIVK